MNKGNVKGEWQHSVSVFLKPNYIPCTVELKQTQGRVCPPVAPTSRHQALYEDVMEDATSLLREPSLHPLVDVSAYSLTSSRWKKVCNSCQVEPEQPFCWSSAISEVGPVGRCPSYVLIVKETFLVKSQTLLEACLRLCPKYKKLR